MHNVVDTSTALCIYLPSGNDCHVVNLALTEPMDKAEELVLIASNWSGEHWNQVNRTLHKVWMDTGRCDNRKGWDCLKAMRYVKGYLVDPCAKDESKGERQSWTVRWPLGVRQEAAMEIVGRIIDEFELGNIPTH